MKGASFGSLIQGRQGVRTVQVMVLADLSDERAVARQMSTDNQALNFDGALIGDERFHVTQMTHDMKVERDPVTA